MGDERVAYVVTSGSYSDYSVERVYLDRAEAERFCNYRDYYQIEEYPIGAGCAEYDGPGFRGWWTYRPITGSLDAPFKSAEWWTDSENWAENFCVQDIWHTGDPAKAKVTVRDVEPVTYVRTVQVIGTSREHVEKSLRDAAAQMKAEALGVA